MAKSGDRFELPDGSTFVVERSTAETGGEYVEMTATVAARTFSPLPHAHPRATDRFEVLEGRVQVMVDGSWRTLGPGDELTIPPGTVHTMRNRFDDPVRIRVTHTPAMRLEDYFERFHGLARARGIKGARDPRVPILVSMLMLEYPDTLAFPRRRERTVARTLARLGRALRFSTAP
ncbi:MAG: cupin domain-containing protein [Solirubrobacteraceae bacterium]